VEVKLIVIEGKAKGKEIPLPASQFIIGRSSRCHLRPHSEQVSKVHCAIGRKPGNRVVVRDMKSRNKTYINGDPITGTVRVKDGDILEVGPLKFQFVIDAKTPSEPLHEDHILWLMDSSADSFDVESSADTTVIELPKDLIKENDEVESSEHGLSAGQYLKDQVRRSGEASASLQTLAAQPMTIQLEASQLAFLNQLAEGMRREFTSTVPTRDELVRTLIEAVSEMKIDLSTIKSLDDLKAAIAAVRR